LTEAGLEKYICSVDEHYFWLGQYNEKGKQELFTCIKSLQSAQLLTERNLEVFFNDHSGASWARQAFINFSWKMKPSLLTQQNFDLICSQGRDANEFYKMMTVLEPIGLLTQQNFEAIESFLKPYRSAFSRGNKHEYRLFSALSELAKNGSLTQGCFDAMVAVGPNIDKDFIKLHLMLKSFQPLSSKCHEKIALSTKYRQVPQDILQKLINENFIITENLERCLEGRVVLNIMEYLDGTPLWSKANFDSSIAIDTPDGALRLCFFLKPCGLLTQENFNHAIQNSRGIFDVLNARNLRDSFNRIPPHLITQDFINRFFQLCEQARRERSYDAVAQIIIADITQLIRMGEEVLPVVDRNALAEREDRQNTHIASVHKTVSESALRLKTRYGAKLEGDGLQVTLAAATSWVRALPEELQDPVGKNAAAKRCIDRIGKSSFVDPQSQTKTPELLALTWLAIHDDSQRIGLVEDARNLWIDGLYEMQRGYNLSAVGVDDGKKEDRPSCEAGTFNKFIEKLQGVHPDAVIIHISNARASDKLQSVVKEEVKRYLAGLPSSTLNEVFVELEKSGLEIIWDKIQPEIARRIFEEFGSLYRGNQDPEFIQLISFGKDVDLGDLNRLKPTIANSNLSTNEITIISSQSNNNQEKAVSPASAHDSHLIANEALPSRQAPVVQEPVTLALEAGLLTDESGLPQPPPSVDGRESEKRQQTNKEIIKALEIGIIGEDGCKKWATACFGGVDRQIENIRGEEVGTAHITATMDVILDRITDATQQIKNDLGRENEIYREALVDIKNILGTACHQNNKWQACFFGRKDPSKTFYNSWSQKLNENLEFSESVSLKACNLM
jgi:hypothetical protein